MSKPKWTGLCPAGRHGLDWYGQRCDLCLLPAATIPVPRETLEQVREALDLSFGGPCHDKKPCRHSECAALESLNRLLGGG